MKKIICILLIFALALPMYASAENVLEKYEKLLTGKWISAGYTNVSSSSDHIAYLIQGFEYPGTHDVSYASGKGTLSVTAILSGDDTGETYLTLTHLSSSTVGRVYLSSDGAFLLLICPDNSIFYFTKE